MTNTTVYSADPRKIKRIFNRLRKAHTTWPPAPVSNTANWCMGGVMTANCSTDPLGVIMIPRNFWTRTFRKAVREARVMGLPRY